MLRTGVGGAVSEAGGSRNGWVRFMEKPENRPAKEEIVSPHRVRVDKLSNGCVIHALDRPADLHATFVKVFEAVNAAEALPEHARSGAHYQALYDQGPVLFNEMVIDHDTGASTAQLGGLQVSHQRLPATLAKLQELGFEVVE
jgi:hypothetical protein